MATYESKKSNELRRKLMSLNFEEVDTAIKRIRGETVASDELENIKQRRAELSDILDIYESRHLIRKAEKWGIEVPYKEEWYTHLTRYPVDST